jgi:flavin reductase (DIM6/NTAB) family NADH-FMN oxidoreductase RutF
MMPENTITENEQKKYRAALSNFATGITLVTSLDDNEQPFGITINSFVSISLVPKIIAWSLGQNNKYEPLFYTRPYIIQILAENHIDIAQQFSKTDLSQNFNASLFDYIHNIPVLKTCLSYFICNAYQAIHVGDHTLFLSNVQQFSSCIDVNTYLQKGALVFFKKTMLNLDLPNL